jgi:hypothetical protein
MAKFALINSSKIVEQIVIADSEADLGPYAVLHDAVSIDHLEVQPSTGWALKGDVFVPNVGAVADLWHGTGFKETEIKEVETPVKASAKETKKSPK